MSNRLTVLAADIAPRRWLCTSAEVRRMGSAAEGSNGDRCAGCS
jgi:hypothetical protein